MHSSVWVSRVKKTVSYVERNEVQRTEFQETVDSLPESSLYYVDECGLDKYLYREYGYAPRGVSIEGKVSGKKFKRMNIVAAKCGDTIVAPMVYESTTDSILFEFWFEYVLLPSIPEKSVIVLDNAAFHRKSMLYGIADAAGCELLFLPPYSPDLNAIEKFRAWLKARLRKILPLFDSFEEALVNCF